MSSCASSSRSSASISRSVGQQLLGLLRDREHLVGVRPAHGDGLAAPREPVLGIGTNRREHRERAPVVLVPQERRRGELVQAEHDVDPERGDAATFATVEDRDRGLDAERARDHRRALVEAQHGLGQQPDAPVHRRAQAALPRRDRGGMAPDRVVARPGAGALETADHARALVGQAVLELVDELVRGEDPQRGCRELDRERDAVEPAADRRRDGGVRRRRLDLGAADPGPGEEQLDGGVPGEHVGVGLVLRRHRQGLDPDDALAGHADRDPARREDRQPGRPGEEVGEGRRGGPHVLDGVEDEDARLAAQGLGEGLDDRPAGLLRDAHGAGDRGQDQRRVVDAVEGHERHAAVPPRQRAAGELDGEPALPHPADPGERDERPVAAQGEPADGRDVGLAPDQRRVRNVGDRTGPARVDAVAW